MHGNYQEPNRAFACAAHIQSPVSMDLGTVVLLHLWLFCPHQ